MGANDPPRGAEGAGAPTYEAMARMRRAEMSEGARSAELTVTMVGAPN
jgi:hypothetical protein